jgi:hypothetical protein
MFKGTVFDIDFEADLRKVFAEDGYLQDATNVRNANKLLQYAESIIWHAVRKTFSSTSALHIASVKKAVVAQVAFWYENDVSPESDAGISSYSLGDLSVTRESSNGNPATTLCKFAKMFLNEEHLIYRGLGGNCNGQQIGGEII